MTVAFKNCQYVNGHLPPWLKQPHSHTYPSHSSCLNLTNEGNDWPVGGRDIFAEQADVQPSERETGLLEWRTLRSQQYEEFERSLAIDRERDIVAFAGSEEMASEIFSLQKAMSPTAHLSTRGSSLADNGITEPCTLYINWMSGDAVEDIMSNSSIVDDQTPAEPPTTIPTFSPAPSPTHSPSYISIPLSPEQEDIEGPIDITVKLKTLRSRVHHLALTANQINVLCGEEFDCASRAFRRPAFNPESKLDS
uniref:uncharacterized protein n=1 Tax=Semicossyphus pulcher TaxID=241346 RepID=UPI0037E7F621